MSSLWIPPQYVPDKTDEKSIPLPERPQEKKRIAFKWRYDKDSPWYGGTVVADRDLDINTAMVQGTEITLAASLRLYLTGQIERATGSFIWQDGDHMQSNMLIEEWTLDEEEKAGGYPERWARFVRREP